MIKKIIYCFLLIIFLIGLERFCHHQTDGFAIHKISSNLSFNPEWETKPLSPIEKDRLKTILAQKFTYLGKGAQCYAFLSEDKNFVIKFFRHDHMRRSFLQHKKEKIQIKKMKLVKDFTSYKIAYDELKDETGLIYLHLNKTEHLKQKVTFFDKIRVVHTLDLDKFEFVVQKRADLFYGAIDDLMQKGNVDAAKEAIRSMVKLVVLRSSKGIFDKDPDLATNFGIAKGYVVQIDIGRFRKDPSRTDPAIYRQDLLRMTAPFKDWLKKEHPDLSKTLGDELDHLLDSQGRNLLVSTDL